MQPEQASTPRPFTATLRRATEQDAQLIAELAAEHAAYERSEAAPPVEDLARALDSLPPRLWVWLAEARGAVLGYAAATEEFCTWRAGLYLHLDCLFVREPHRGRGLGAALFHEVERHARSQGISRVEWQTPLWNRDAIRFYELMGGRHDPKARFTLALT